MSDETENDTPEVEQRSEVGVVARNAERGAQVTQTNIESNRLVPTLVALAAAGLVLSGLAFGMAIWAGNKADVANDRARRAETRADLAELEVESFQNVLHAAHLPTSAHLPGESP